jgi:hypothetical protein
MFLWGLWIDPLYLVLFVVTLVISGASQLYIRKTCAKWNAVDDGVRLSGLEIRERPLTHTSFGGVVGRGSGCAGSVSSSSPSWSS